MNGLQSYFYVLDVAEERSYFTESDALLYRSLQAIRRDLVRAYLVIGRGDGDFARMVDKAPLVADLHRRKSLVEHSDVRDRIW